MAATGTRRSARAYALQVLYAADVSESDGLPLVSRLGKVFDVEVEPAALEFARKLVDLATREAAAIEEQIAGASRNWRIERMSRVDRNILRLATAELLGEGATPTKVIVDEGVELAKAFGSEESPAFINGILDKIAASARG